MNELDEIVEMVGVVNILDIKEIDIGDRLLRWWRLMCEMNG